MGSPWRETRRARSAGSGRSLEGGEIVNIIICITAATTTYYFYYYYYYYYYCYYSLIVPNSA